MVICSRTNRGSRPAPTLPAPILDLISAAPPASSCVSLGGAVGVLSRCIGAAGIFLRDWICWPHFSHRLRERRPAARRRRPQQAVRLHRSGIRVRPGQEQAARSARRSGAGVRRGRVRGGVRRGAGAGLTKAWVPSSLLPLQYSGFLGESLNIFKPSQLTRKHICIKSDFCKFTSSGRPTHYSSTLACTLLRQMRTRNGGHRRARSKSTLNSRGSNVAEGNFGG